jgi:hypothetical protein
LGGNLGGKALREEASANDIRPRPVKQDGPQ